ncbi:hypothetical protein V2I52_11595 [Brenneria sp. g21c3]|uniref:hypothetical protein n=1 Tax=Brenneria sp. g21c3 TaxID=3093893 RepID=UPI002EC0E5AC|nr:hypothetical protein [Brenneria sp. g21c3]
MIDAITVNFERLGESLNKLREKNNSGKALTTEIIEIYMGGFHSNKGVPVNDSWNAQFGKYLKRHAVELGISENRKNVRIGNTTASEWNLFIAAE